MSDIHSFTSTLNTPRDYQNNSDGNQTNVNNSSDNSIAGNSTNNYNNSSGSITVAGDPHSVTKARADKKHQRAGRSKSADASGHRIHNKREKKSLGSETSSSDIFGKKPTEENYPYRASIDLETDNWLAYVDDVEYERFPEEREKDQHSFSNDSTPPRSGSDISGETNFINDDYSHSVGGAASDPNLNNARSTSSGRVWNAMQAKKPRDQIGVVSPKISGSLVRKTTHKEHHLKNAVKSLHKICTFFEERPKFQNIVFLTGANMNFKVPSLYPSLLKSHVKNAGRAIDAYEKANPNPNDKHLTEHAARLCKAMLSDLNTKAHLELNHKEIDSLVKHTCEFGPSLIATQAFIAEIKMMGNAAAPFHPGFGSREDFCMLDFGTLLEAAAASEQEKSFVTGKLSDAAFQVRMADLEATFDGRFKIDFGFDGSVHQHRVDFRLPSHRWGDKTLLAGLEIDSDFLHKRKLGQKNISFVDDHGSCEFNTSHESKEDISKFLEQYAGGPSGQVLTEVLECGISEYMTESWFQDGREYKFVSPQHAEISFYSTSATADAGDKGESQINVSRDKDYFIIELSHTHMFHAVYEVGVMSAEDDAIIEGLDNQSAAKKPYMPRTRNYIHVDPRDQDVGGKVVKCMQAKAKATIYMPRKAVESGEIKFDHDLSEMHVDYSGSFAMPERPMVGDIST